MDDPESEILRSWRVNAEPWTTAIRDDLIDSRVLVTNQAVMDAVMSRSPRSVLDIGCGEGWLSRELAGRGVRAIGVDAIPALIEEARRAGSGKGDFRVVSYEEIADGRLDVTVDVAVANFALLGGDSVERMIVALPRMLTERGALVIQTLHPLVACGDQPYKEGWRPGTWAAAKLNLTDPAPWYFRTLEGWIRLLVSSGFRLVEMREPIHPETGKPASVIFIAAKEGATGVRP